MVVSLFRHKKGEGKKSRIIRVEALDNDCFGVTLESGHTIMLELGGRTREPAFAALIDSGAFDKPQTDGNRLYWTGGPSITLEEIFEMLSGQKDFAKDAHS